MDGQTLHLRGRLDGVQLLRAVAAMAVVVQHLPQWGNGEWGVDLFFVISGFIVCHATQASGAHFLLKRFIRIVPLYWAGTLGVFALAMIAPGLLKNTVADPLHLLQSLAFIPFVKGQAVQPVMFLGWTLNLEVFFYAVFALSMAAGHARRTVVCAALLCALAWAGAHLPLPGTALPFWTQPLLLEFVLGIACFHLVSRLARHPRLADARVRLLNLVLGLACLAALVLVDAHIEFDNRVIKYGLLAAGCFLFTVLALLDLDLPRAVVLLGDASYSLYLLHPYVLRPLHRWLDQAGGAGQLACAAALALCCGLAVLVYLLLEQPLTRYLRRRLVDGPAARGAAATTPQPGTASSC